MLYRITATTGTIPSTANTGLLGTVTTDTANTKVLIYTGSNDVGQIYTQGRTSIVDGPMWICVPGVTPFLARVVGCYHAVIDPIVANNVWTITLDRALPGCAGSACKYLQGPAWYHATNDGGHDITVTDGEIGSQIALTLHTAGVVTPKGYQLNVQRVKLYAPVYIDASDSDVLCEVQI